MSKGRILVVDDDAELGALIADILFLPALLYWMKPDLKPKA